MRESNHLFLKVSGNNWLLAIPAGKFLAVCTVPPHLAQGPCASTLTGLPSKVGAKVSSDPLAWDACTTPLRNPSLTPKGGICTLAGWVPLLFNGETVIRV